MRAFFLLSLVAAVYGMPASPMRPQVLPAIPMQPDIMPGSPIIIDQNPIDMTRPIGPNIDNLINSAIIGEITRPTHIDNGIPSIDGPTIIDLPAEIAPMVQIIVNIVKKAEPVMDKPISLLPIFPSEPDFGVFPNQPDLTRPDTGIDTDLLKPGTPEKPDFGVFPMLPELTRPNTGVDTDILRPGRPGVQTLDIPMNSIVDRPATSIIR